jgi:hypothetical protein
VIESLQANGDVHVIGQFGRYLMASCGDDCERTRAAQSDSHQKPQEHTIIEFRAMQIIEQESGVLAALPATCEFIAERGEQFVSLK